MKFIQKITVKFFAGVCLAFLSLTLTHAGIGIGGSGRGYGYISDFGSIFVNGVEYDISSANIIISGTPNLTQADLKKGMAVRVEGSVDANGTTGTATLVEFLGDIEGAVDAVPTIVGSDGTFTIYGLVVKTDSNTQFHTDITLATMRAGDIVEVSGLFNANDGSFSATFVEKKLAFRKVDLRGFISNVNLVAKTFRLSPTLVIDYSAIPNHDYPDSGSFTNGMFVEVKNTMVQPANGLLVAERASQESSVLRSLDMPLGVLQGVAANVTPNSFVMGNQPITTDNSTVFDGLPISALLSGAKAIAAGPVVAGVMNAQFVTIPVSVSKAWSRKSHGTAGDFELKLDTKASRSSNNLVVEPRVIGSGHTIVIEFNGPVTSVGSVKATDSSGAPIGGAPIGNLPFSIPMVPDNQVIVTLTGVPDDNRVQIELINVNLTGHNAAISMGFLVGDVNNSHGISAGHLSSIKARSGQTVQDNNFIYDLKTSGTVNAVDISVVKQRNGRQLAP